MIRKTLLVVASLVAVGLGQRPQVVVFASDAMQAALQDLRPQLERATGGSITFQFSTSPILQRRIVSGEPFDVAVLPPATISSLQNGKKTASDTPVDLARVGIGIGIRTGASRADIHTADALKRTLLAAKSIVYVKEGASRANVDQMLERLGIAPQVAAKTLLQSGFEEMGRSIAGRQAELVIVPLSEIPLMPGVSVLGPLPPELQSYVAFQAVVSSDTKNAEAARTIVRVLASPAAATVYKAKGME